MKFEKILIAVDNGPTAEKVVESGKKLAKKLDAQVAIVSVLNMEFIMTDGFVTPKEMEGLMREEFIKNQKILVDKFFKKKKVRTFIEDGKPFEAIIKVAEEWKADLIVMGTHGRTGINHFILGSVAEKVTRHSEIPLFIVPTKSP